MADGQLTGDAVMRALDDFTDPEAGRSVVSLAQVHALRVDGDRAAITLGLTTYSAPLWDETRAQLVEHLQARLPGLRHVDVTVEPHPRPAERMGEVGLPAKSVIAVGSGKGGVGKSTIAAVLAYGLSRAGSKVGLMDADVYGPSIPHLLGATGRPYLVNGRIQPSQVDGMAVMAMGLLVPAGVDMPPGTGDVALTLSQLLPLTGAVVVCTPQDLALLDAVKAIAMFRKVSIEVVGMVENMSHFVCPGCGARHDIFGSGGARRKAAELGVPFLGEVPLNTQMRIYGDEGKLSASFADAHSAPHLEALARNLVRNLTARRRQKPPLPSLTVLR